MQITRQVTLLAALFLIAPACGSNSGSSSNNSTSSAIGRGASSPSPAASGQSVEFHGTVDSIVAPTLSVGTRAVTTDASTRFYKDHAAIAFDAITVGAYVEVKGTVQTDGSVLATSIELSSSDSSSGSHDDDADEHAHHADTIIFKAAFQGASDDAKTIHVGDLAVTISDTTRLVKGDATVTVADLVVGDTLVVRGVLQPGPTVAASKIRVLVPGAPDHSDDDDDDDSDHE